MECKEHVLYVNSLNENVNNKLLFECFNEPVSLQLHKLDDKDKLDV